jgi:hypothetical protein
VSQHWRSGADDLTISRRLAQQYFARAITPERLDALTIAGRPAVVVKPRYQGEEAFVLMRDDVSFWTIQSKAVAPDVLVEIAASITTP